MHFVTSLHHECVVMTDRIVFKPCNVLSYLMLLYLHCAFTFIIWYFCTYTMHFAFTYDIIIFTPCIVVSYLILLYLHHVLYLHI